MNVRLKSIDTAFQAILEAQPPRAGSLIVTVFGNSISQHGNSVWLGSLIVALEPFGLNARQIRTAVFRLVKDGWLSRVRIGRRSFYSFTEFGQRQYEKSARRIYKARPITWDGQWTLVLPVFADADQRDRLKRQLSWLGFGSIANGVLAHPCADVGSLAETLRELGLDELVVTLCATTAPAVSRDVLKRVMQQSWRLDELETRYQNFVASFIPVLNVLEKTRRYEAAQMFQLQTIVVHEYRRILLKTADLPDELLPEIWSGRAAMDLTARLYRLLHEPAAAYLEAHFEGPDGLLAKAGDAYFRRFI
ncbi:MAG: phenylacetic acid degradation operon negative regulatory protein PaaX [Gammaproteobacteria bacterium]|nr:phenylacetic acid degradation operon negative regulatory protein PaaX [Gammaproteobacteria bacterium]